MTKISVSETAALSIYLRLMAYVKPYWVFFVVCVIGYILYAIANVMFSKIMENLVIAVESKEESARWLVPVQILLATLLRGLGMFVGTYFMAKVAFGIIDDLRVQVFTHMTKLPASVLDGRPSGHLISLITYNINGVTAAATDAAKKGLREGATVIGLLGYLFYLDWKLTLLFVSVAPLIGLLVSTVAKRLRRLSRKVQDSVGDITQVSSEMINGYKVMRSFGGEPYERDRFVRASKKNYAQNMKIIVTSAANAPLMHLLIAFSMGLLIFVALNFMQIKSTATFIGYITAVGMILQPIRQLGEVAPQILKGVAAAESVFGLLDEMPEKDTGTRVVERVSGRIEFRNLSFTYPGQQQPALRHFSLGVDAGEIVALVCKSGSGKSTLVNVLPRFYDIDEGDILLDGISQREFRLDNLRQQIALVNQNVVLFEGSIADNIAYGCRDQVSFLQIKTAADLAFVTEFVESLPEGFDTLIGEGGARLSGGQRQRIAIARAILKNAPILILDEATSALDNESEHFIQAALESVMKGRTTFIVAHRLSTVEKADKIIVMGDGEILEQGSHEQLLAMNGHYTRLHSRQFDDSPDL